MSGSSAAGGFGARVQDAISSRGRLCAGIDPHAALLQAWGLGTDEAGLNAFADICVTALGPVAAVIKPQVAFFELYGAAGFAALERVITGCHEAGALVLADAKRGDIGTTMAAYASAWLDPAAPLASDALTVSPYLGFGSLAPAIETARASRRGVFVLARTSNPEGFRVQLADADGRTVSQRIVDAAAAENADGTGTVGVVVGATRAHHLDLTRLQGPILAPGLGAQGATAGDLGAVFADADIRWLLPATSRGVLRAGPDVAALRAAFATARDEVEAALPVR